MHLYVATRGIKQDVDRWVKNMESQHFPHKVRKNVHDTKEPITDVHVQLSMRPVQFWEIVFPESSRDVILNTLWRGERPKTEGHFGNMATMKYKKIMPILRRCLGKEVCPIPSDYVKTHALMVHTKNIEFLGVGVKEDAKINGVEML